MIGTANPHACGVDDIARPFLAPRQIVFIKWIILVSGNGLFLPSAEALAYGLYIDRLRPNLFQFDFAALVSKDQLHSLDQVCSKGFLIRSSFLWHSIALLSDERDLPQFFLFVRRQIRSDIFRITAEHLNACGDYNV